ncbi:metallophosphoesterase [Halanaerobacter jeridensis]|uniref:DNA repair exonuclease SbcCD nuclease subunit n=1 Tax=Halanaerobacter jeridensis TaxID=706427 RepID=A0A938XS73_9FIRM|nr:metallophosphoesterase [Halanaerobacter jeridensis]MBM7556726.1 DNA repair exonuclease SbcCD nuclease subunit [Halanaerobacter jeridensis]
MAALKFIHAADIHLGSTIQLPQLDISKQQEKLLEKANFNAFAYIIETAISQEVDFIILAGDVYDQQQRSIKANQSN